MPRTVSIASKVGPAVTSTLRPASLLGREEVLHGFQQLLGLEHAAHADLAARLVAGRGAEDRDAIAAQQGDVALRRGVVPHLAVHRGGDEERAVAREARRREQVVGEAVGELGEEVGARGRDHDRIRPARELDVRHAVGEARDPRGP